MPDVWQELELMKKVCRKSGKVKFDTHEQAAIRAGEILSGLVRGHGIDDPIKELGTYKCEFCNKWHLTKQTESAHPPLI
jgi:hypothetical protein